MEAWRQRLLGGRKTFVSEKEHLTPTGLLMEGDYTQNASKLIAERVENCRFLAHPFGYLAVLVRSGQSLTAQVRLRMGRDDKNGAY